MIALLLLVTGVLGADAGVDAEIAGGSEHVYAVPAPRDHFVRLAVVPRGPELTVTLERNGARVVEVGGHEALVRVVSFVADDGVFELRVRAAGAPERTGRYQVEVRAWRPAGAGDAERVEADRDSAAAQILRREGSKPSQQRARELLEAAALAFRRLGDALDEADALDALGETAFGLGDPEGARSWFERELALRRAHADREGEGTVLNNLGVVHRFLGHPRQAIEAYEQALPLRRAAGDVRGEAQTLSNIGVAWALLDEYQKAVESLHLALPLRRKAGDLRGEGHTLHSLGAFHFSLGDLDRALEFGQQAVDIRRELGDRAAEAQTLQGMGLAWSQKGDPGRARELLERALELRRQTGDKLGEGGALHDLGEVYTVSDPARSLAYFEAALPLRHSTRDVRGEGDTAHALGEAQMRIGDHASAAKKLATALAIRREIGDRTGEADTLFAQGRLARDAGRLEEARLRMEEALAILDALRVKVARQDLRQSFVERRQQQYEEYLDLLLDLHRRDGASTTASAAFAAAEHARARTLRDLLLEAGADVRRGLPAAVAERLRAAREQLSARERERLRLLGGPSSDAQRAAAQKAVGEAMASYREAEGAARASYPQLAALTEPHVPDPAALQALLDDDTLLLEYALGSRRSHLFIVTRQALVVVQLPPRGVIEAVARRTHERLVASRRSDARVAAGAATRELSDLLLGPAAAWLRHRRVVVVPDGALHAVPFGALPRPGSDEVMLASREVVQLPALSVLAQLRDSRSRPPQPGLHVVLADPVLDVSDARVAAAGRPRPVAMARGAWPAALLRSLGDDVVPELGPLPFSRREAESIRDLAGRRHTRLALGFDASRESVLAGSLGEAAVVHFATHGLLNGVHPELSGLVLSLVDRDGRPQDGFLRLHDVYNLDLAADLVVLSACRTAMGRDVRGEGVVGLTRGFMYAGAPRVVASLWDVRDDSAAELMRRFYAGMLQRKMTAAAALRAAQLSMSREPRWAAPFHWAGFVLQGEWR